jgi:O-antigen/teichoic acid export membrane protein
MVGSEAYGLYFALFNFSILFNAFLDLGITNFNNRSIAQTPALIRIYFPRLFLSKLLLGVVYSILCLAISFISGYRHDAIILIGILAANQFLASLLLFLRSNISGLQLYTIDSIISVTDRFLLIILCSILLWTNFFPVEINIFIFALSQTIAYLLTCILATIIILKKSRGITFKNTPLFSVNLFRKSLPFALLILLMALHTRIDAIFIERLLPHGAAKAGIYAQSYRIFDAVTMISVLFASLLLPMFSRLLAIKESVLPLLKLSFSILFTGTAIFSIVAAGFSSKILNVLYTETHAESSLVFILLSICIIPVSLTYIFGTLLTANGSLKELNIIAGLTLGINLISNLILIPALGITGAAVSALASQLFAAITQIFICKVKFHFSLNWKKAGSYIMLLAITIFLMYFFKASKMSFILQLVLPLSISILLSFLLKIINLRELIQTIKAENQS